MQTPLTEEDHEMWWKPPNSPFFWNLSLESRITLCKCNTKLPICPLLAVFHQCTSTVYFHICMAWYLHVLSCYCKVLYPLGGKKRQRKQFSIHCTKSSFCFFFLNDIQQGTRKQKEKVIWYKLECSSKIYNKTKLIKSRSLIPCS